MSGNLGAKLDRMNALLAQILERLPERLPPIEQQVAAVREMVAEQQLKRGPGRPRKQ